MGYCRSCKRHYPAALGVGETSSCIHCEKYEREDSMYCDDCGGLKNGGNSDGENGCTCGWSNKKDNNGCYIATVCYGTYDSKEVIVFRKYRDEVLNKIVFGRIFVKTYYLLSPPVAKKLKNYPLINTFIKTKILDKIYNNLNKKK